MEIQENLSSIKQRISAAASRSGRDAAEIKLVAVSKMTGIMEISEAISFGQHDFGENRALQLRTRKQLFPSENWHMIGRLQTNKVKEVVENACLIHSVDRMELAKEISKRSLQSGIIMPCLLQVNISGEEQKAGIKKEDTVDFLKEAENLKGIVFYGLMTMAPEVPIGEAEKVRYVFKELKELFDTIKTMSFANVMMKELSMGMSNDFEIAIEEGATIVRIGSAIFPKIM